MGDNYVSCSFLFCKTGKTWRNLYGIEIIFSKNTQDNNATVLGKIHISKFDLQNDLQKTAIDTSVVSVSLKSPKSSIFFRNNCVI